MRVKQRLELVDKIARELEATYDASDIDVFLDHFFIEIPRGVVPNSKRLYVKYALEKASAETIMLMADELDVRIPSLPSFSAVPPKNWEKTDSFRLFISHLAIHKDKAKRMKDTLAPYHIASFVAHEDINPTLEWQKEIERALATMDAMLSIHTKGFSESVWTQQEIGYALGRGVRVIALNIDELPRGFISKDQAVLRRGRDASEISEEVVALLTNDAATKTRMAEVRANHQKVENGDIPF